MTLNVQRCLYDVVAAIAADRDVPRELVLAVILQESGGDPDAIGDDGHSVGLMQLHDRGEGSGMTVEDRQNIYRTISQAVFSLHQNYMNLCDWEDALVVYNMGFRAWVEWGRPSETPYTLAVNGFRDRILREGCARPVACKRLMWWD